MSSDPNEDGLYYSSVSSDGEYGGFFYSRDRGLNWNAYNEGLQESAGTIGDILPSSRSRKVYLATSEGVFTGTPSQQPWQKIEVTAQLIVHDMAFANPRESALFLATSDGIHNLDLTANTSTRLIIPDYPGEVHAVFYDDSTGQLFAGTNRGVYRSNDRGRTWQIKLPGLPDSPVNVLEKSGARLFSGTREGLFASDDNGNRWSRSRGIHPIDIIDIQANPQAENQIFAADLVVGQLFFTTDGGNQWEMISLGTYSSKIAALSFSSSGRLLAGTNSDGIYGIAPPTESLANGR